MREGSEGLSLRQQRREPPARPGGASRSEESLVQLIGALTKVPPWRLCLPVGPGGCLGLDLYFYLSLKLIFFGLRLLLQTFSYPKPALGRV